MNFILIRKTFWLYGVFGEMKSEDGNVSFVTLEHAYSVGKEWLPKLAPGVYTCVRHEPVRLHYTTFMVQGVPNFQGAPVTGLLIHVLNYNNESEGCIGIGLQMGTGCILESRKAFDQFMELQKGVDSFTLTVAS